MQAIHAAMMSANAFRQAVEPPNVVLLSVPDEPALLAAYETLRRQVPMIAWREPDFGNTLTALASAPVGSQHRKHFRGYPLHGSP